MANTAQLCGLWSPAAIFGRPQTRSRTSSAGYCSSTFTVQFHIPKICIFFGYQQYRSDQKWQTVERRTFRVTIPTNPDGFGKEQTFCQQSLEKEQSLCAFYVLPPSSPESSDPRSLFMCYEWEIPVEDAAFPFYVNCTWLTDCANATHLWLWEAVSSLSGDFALTQEADSQSRASNH